MSSKFALSMLEYAEMDLENCRILIEQDKLYNLIVLHAQQVVEKSLKALLTYHGEKIGNYHDTKSLCIKAEKIIIDFKDYRNDCSDLANVYVATHYSDINDDVILFTQNNAIKFYEIAKEIFSLVSNEIAE
jgi:HEPN domain-containing protein